MAYPIVLTAIAPMEYFQRREPFSLLGLILSNPLIFLGMLFVGVIVAFPNLMQMDPELMEEAGKGHEEMTEAMEKLKGSFLGAATTAIAGSTPSSSSASNSNGAASSSSGGASSNPSLAAKASNRP